jgi:hypothetical protein
MPARNLRNGFKTGVYREVEMVSTILTALGASALALAVIGWLVRSIITHWLSKDIEQFKTTIKYEKDIEIERLRVELSKMAAEHQIRFQQLHTKVFATIARLYRLIATTQMEMGAYFSISTEAGGLTEEQRGRKAMEAWNTLNSFFRAHEIYFDKGTCKAVNEYLGEFYGMVIDFQSRKIEKGKYIEKWKKVWDKLNNDMETLKRGLEDSFRAQIGVKP